MGDYDPEIHVGHYVAVLKVLLKQTQAIEEKTMDIHQKQMKGRDQSQVEYSFLKLACQLDTYGVDPHPVKVRLNRRQRITNMLPPKAFLPTSK